MTDYIDKLNLPTLIHNCLLRNRIRTVEELKDKTKQELLNLNGFKQSYLAEIRSRLCRKNQS